MVFTDHQVRQFYVVDSTHTATPKVSNHKFYVKYIDPSGTTITTDKIDSGCIRDIRITRQPGFVPKVWNIYPSKTSVTDTYVLHMTFRNAFGGGVNDFLIKDPAILAIPGEGVSTLVTKLFKAVNKAFNLTVDPSDSTIAANPNVPFKTKNNSTYLTITETVPSYNRDSTIRGMYQLGLDLDIHCGEKTAATDSSSDLHEAGNPWGLVNPYSGTTAITALNDILAESTTQNSYFFHEGILYKYTGSASVNAGYFPSTNVAEVANFNQYCKGIAATDDTLALHNATTYATATAYSAGDYVIESGKYYKITADIASGSNTDFSDLTTTEITTFYPNGPMIAEMEYFFSKGRADLYGYMGFPDVNPSEMVASAANDYYILDIKYFYQEAGVNNQNSEKELSFACTNKSDLEGIIYSASVAGDRIVSSTTGTSISGVNGCEIYTPVAY